MNYSIVFSSVTGNTAAVADHLRKLLPAEHFTYYGEPSSEAMESNVIFVGFWTDKGSCDEKTRFFLRNLENKTVILFGTAGFGSGRDYFQRVLEAAESHIPVSNTVLPGFMCSGKMRPEVKEHYEKMLRNNQEDPRANMMLENFDLVSSHPDEEDFKELEAWVKQFHL